MEPKEFKIQVHSITRFIFLWWAIMCSLFLLLDKFTPKIESEFVFAIQTITIIGISVFSAHLLGRGKLKIVLSEKGLSHIWEQRFIFSREKSFIINWDLIEDFYFQEDRIFNSFILNLKIKKRYEINRLNLIPLNDDYKELERDFSSLSNTYKNCYKTSEIVSKPIKKGKSVYQERGMKAVFFVMLAIFIFLFINKLLDTQDGSTWPALAVIGSGLIFFGTMVYEKKEIRMNNKC